DSSCKLDTTLGLRRKQAEVARRERPVATTTFGRHTQNKFSLAGETLMFASNELARAVKRALLTHAVGDPTAAGSTRPRASRWAGALAGALIASAPIAVHAQSNVEGYVYGQGQAGTEVRLK